MKFPTTGPVPMPAPSARPLIEQIQAERPGLYESLQVLSVAVEQAEAGA